MKSTKLSILVLSMTLASSLASAAPACRNIFAYSPKTLQLVEMDAVKQWLYWEQQSNFAIFRKSGEPFPVPIVKIPRDSVKITYGDNAPTSLKNLIDNGGAEVNWFKHPYNTDGNVPHFFDTVSGSSVVTYFTASRSLALNLGKDVFTIKMGTDRPHGPEGQYQPAKASTREDILDGINRMEYIDAVNRKVGTDPSLILAKEVAFVADRAIGEGYLFRDISFMNDGNYYLPALSIPYAGREIAKHNRSNPDFFWKKHYAQLLGAAKAKLLLRYGLQMETPNSQNMLIQLDRNLKPTGKIVFRDISDTMLVEGFARELGAEAVLQKDATLGVENTKDYKPFPSNSFWRFDEAGANAFSMKTISEWTFAHDRAYFKEIGKALGVNLNNFLFADGNPAFKKFMDTPEVKAKIREYRQRLEKEHQESQKPEFPLVAIEQAS